MSPDMSMGKPFDIQACLRTIKKGEQMSTASRVDVKTCEHKYVKRRYKIVKNKTLNGFAECIICGSWYDCDVSSPEEYQSRKSDNVKGKKRRRPIRRRKGLDDL